MVYAYWPYAQIVHLGSNMHTIVQIKCIDFVILFQSRLTLYGPRIQPSHNSSKQVSMYDARFRFVQICMYTLFLKFLFLILNFEPINGLCKQKKD